LSFPKDVILLLSPGQQQADLLAIPANGIHRAKRATFIINQNAVHPEQFISINVMYGLNI
jgi:hypothetical protein